MRITIVIRTLNEDRFLDDLLTAIETQEFEKIDIRQEDIEILIVDSGSTDNTLQIASRHKCRITTIEKDEFTFGKSLNKGCAAAKGSTLVFVSGHCIPTASDWLENLVYPILKSDIAYCYGRQIGLETSQFSENQLLGKYFPSEEKIPQVDSILVNNANAAISKVVWEAFKFDEEITGLEDMELAQRLVKDGYKIAYCSTSVVFHIHNETLRQIKRRYEREAVALLSIEPDWRISWADFFRYFFASVLSDLNAALRIRRFWKVLPDVVSFRAAQYMGSYQGNHSSVRKINEAKEAYFYPTKRP